MQELVAWHNHAVYINGWLIVGLIILVAFVIRVKD